MTTVSYHINRDIAEIVGIQPAMVLDRLFYHTASRIKNNPNIDLNNIWLYFEGGYKTLSEKFPQCSENKIYRWLQTLAKHDYIEIENRNRHGWNRTNSYKVNHKLFESEILKKYRSFKGVKPTDTYKPGQAPAAPPSTAPTAPTSTAPTAPTAPSSEAKKTKPLQNIIQKSTPIKTAKKSLKQIDSDFEDLAKKFDSTVDEMLKIGQTVFQGYYKKLFNKDFTEFRLTNYAIKDMMFKYENRFSQENKGKKLTKHNLVLKMVFMYHAAAIGKTDSEKFRPPYLNSIMGTNREDSGIYDEGLIWENRHNDKNDSFKLKQRSVPKMILDLLNRL